MRDGVQMPTAPHERYKKGLHTRSSYLPVSASVSTSKREADLVLCQRCNEHAAQDQCLVLIPLRRRVTVDNYFRKVC